MAYGKKSFRPNRVDGFKVTDEHWDNVFPKGTVGHALIEQERLDKETRERQHERNGMKIVPVNASAKAAVRKFHTEKHDAH